MKKNTFKTTIPLMAAALLTCITATGLHPVFAHASNDIHLSQAKTADIPEAFDPSQIETTDIKDDSAQDCFSFCIFAPLDNARILSSKSLNQEQKEKIIKANDESAPYFSELKQILDEGDRIYEQIMQGIEPSQDEFDRRYALFEEQIEQFDVRYDELEQKIYDIFSFYGFESFADIPDDALPLAVPVSPVN